MIKERQIIYVDDKPHIKCVVIMLPTISANNPIVYLYPDGKLYLLPPKTGVAKMLHLYITSDEEIKEGDWYIDDCNKIRQSVTSDKEYWEVRKDYKKIIATTDTSLKIKYDGTSLITDNWDKSLPQPSQQFIEKYIEEFNKGNQITEYLAEVEKKWINSKGEIGNNFNSVALYEESIKEFDAMLIHQLKLDSQNQITIRKQKDNWSRKEVEELCRKAYLVGRGSGRSLLHFDKWIEENL